MRRNIAALLLPKMKRRSLERIWPRTAAPGNRTCVVIAAKSDGSSTTYCRLKPTGVRADTIISPIKSVISSAVAIRFRKLRMVAPRFICLRPQHEEPFTTMAPCFGKCTRWGLLSSRNSWLRPMRLRRECLENGSNSESVES